MAFRGSISRPGRSGERVVEASQAHEHGAAVGVSKEVPRVEGNGPVAGRERLLEARQNIEDARAAVVDPGVLRVEFDGLVGAASASSKRPGD